MKRFKLIYSLPAVSPIGDPVKRIVKATTFSPDKEESQSKEAEVSLGEITFSVVANEGWTVEIQIQTADAAGNLSEPAIDTRVVIDTVPPPKPSLPVFMEEQEGEFEEEGFLDFSITPEPDGESEVEPEVEPEVVDEETTDKLPAPPGAIAVDDETVDYR